MAGEDGALPAAGTAPSGGCSALRGTGRVCTQRDRGQTTPSTSHLGAPKPTTSPYVWAMALGGAASPLQGVSVPGVSLGSGEGFGMTRAPHPPKSFSLHHGDRSEPKGLVEPLDNPMHHDPSELVQTQFPAHAVTA